MWLHIRRVAVCVMAGAALLPGPPPLPGPLPLPSPSFPTILSSPPLSPAVVSSPVSQVSTTAPPIVHYGPAAAAAPAIPARAATPVQSAPAPRPASHRGFSLPLAAIYGASPLDVALIGTLASLPLLLGIWLLLFGRTFAEARRAREAQSRLMLAADLGVHPRDLASMSTKALYALREKAAFDELSGVLRRAAGIGSAEREISRARRHHAPLAVAFVDVDGLKETNDRHGHAAGDALLRSLAAALKEGLRGEDIVFRYGGDEFVCILPGTAAKGARARLGKIQSDAARAGFQFCAGVAQLERQDDVVSLFARADRELYELKAGRGEIVQLPRRRPRKDSRAAGDGATPA